MKEYTKLPSLRRAFLRALLGRKIGIGETALPRFEAVLRDFSSDPAMLDRYREVCGVSAVVPITWPQLLATPVHVSMLTLPSFPLSAMGLVHPRCRIVQHRPLTLDDRLTLECAIEGHRETETGVEFDIDTRGTVDGELVWESCAATFSRDPAKKRTTPKPAREEREWTQTDPLLLPGNAGRSYARVSGDSNPVHLHPITARLFGYRRPIGHGWWLLARCLGALGADGPEGSATVEVEFLRPAWLPSELQLSQLDDGALHFEARDSEDGKIRLAGRIQTGQ